jgi:hypothetical protein
MAHKSTKKAILSSVEYCAKCKNCNYQGEWTRNEDKANQDAIDHMSDPENETHVAIVIVKQ